MEGGCLKRFDETCNFTVSFYCCIKVEVEKDVCMGVFTKNLIASLVSIFQKFSSSGFDCISEWKCAKNCKCQNLVNFNLLFIFKLEIKYKKINSSCNLCFFIYRLIVVSFSRDYHSAISTISLLRLSINYVAFWELTYP